jgi:hypothetical protein
MHEVPDRPVTDLKATLRQFGDQAPQSEVFLLHSPQQPVTVFAGNRLRPVAAHLPRHNAAGLPQTLYPANHRTDADPKLGCRAATGHPIPFNCRNHAFAKIKRIRTAHRMLASIPASMLNQNRPDLGIPIDSG